MKRNYLNPPRIIMFLFMAVLLAAASAIDMSMTGIMNDALIKWAMNGVIVLSLIPMINVGAGRNFGMSIGLSAGLVGMIFSVNARYTSWAGFFYSVFLGMAVALLLGYLYAKILNHLKLNEEIVGTFAGYSFIPVMNLFYTFAPVTNRQMLYPIGGQGLRPKVNLEPYFGQVLDRLWQVRIGELVIPAGLLLSFFGTGFLLWLFSKTRAGMIFSAIAENERFVRLAGINVNGYRTAAIIMSTVIAAAGVVVYSQSYGILHLYDGPFMMSFPAVSAIVIGGASHPIGGQGLRPKVNLEPYFGQVLDRLWQVRIGELVIPAGLLLSFFGTGFLLWLFSKTRAGMIFSAIAENERFVRLAGINVNGYRTAAIIMSTVIAAAGVVVYSQSYGILHLYDGPFMMSFPAVSAIVIGGASPRKATVANALIGTFLYQTTYLLSIPVANALLIPEMAEIMRTIITSGIILYAFIFERKDMRNEAH